MKRILIFGGTGFIGTELIRKLKGDGDYLILVTRKIKSNNAIDYGVDEIAIYKEGLNYLDSSYLKNVDVIINLAGESILGLRWTAKKRIRILNSRKNVIRLIKSSLEQANLKIPLLIQSSATGFYGYSDSNSAVNENSCAGEGFLAEVCAKLEKEVRDLSGCFDRIAIIRLGVVLGKNGFINQISKGFMFKIGFSIGKGEHWFSWIHIDDVINGIKFIIKKESLNGPINFVTKDNIRFIELIKALRNIKNNKIMITIPKTVSKLILGDMSDMLNKGIKVAPNKLIKNGYDYKFTDIEDALKNIIKSSEL